MNTIFLSSSLGSFLAIDVDGWEKIKKVFNINTLWEEFSYY